MPGSIYSQGKEQIYATGNFIKYTYALRIRNIYEWLPAGEIDQVKQNWSFLKNLLKIPTYRYIIVQKYPVSLHADVEDC